MIVTRHDNTSTTANLASLLTAAVDRNVASVRLFASPTAMTPDASPADGPATNFPLLAAMVTFANGDVTVFDGLFLTAQRRARYAEVRDLLDALQDTGKASFADERAPFTAARSPEAACRTLFSLGPVQALTSASRAQYFTYLSTLPEAAFEQ
ncbi:hypothetical protein [Azospirillum canadense]|uniref:hypothetical protein n=1 Tax=Azospirillum canadense TaxID=403962 RepID=UPI0022278EA3|nr:hypothetical protein [Azospirillum canadense]MCW2240701.1 hypothetical protein [Azospirillum canadense]